MSHASYNLPHLQQMPMICVPIIYIIDKVFSYYPDIKCARSMTKMLI